MPRGHAQFLTAQLARSPYEVFCCLHLDNRHRLIHFEEVFRGTIDGASVHPREVVRQALQYNAAALIFAHNHPSGVAEASQADELITRRLRDALALVDIRVLDHLIVGDNTACRSPSAGCSEACRSAVMATPPAPASITSATGFADAKLRARAWLV
jgi:DNA repair protein RadC